MILLIGAVISAHCQSVELPSRMPNGKYVNDYATAFSNEEVENLEKICEDFREHTGNELVFLTVNSLDKMSIESYADSIEQHWTKQLDIYGYWVLVILAPDESKYAIHHGDNVQSELTEEVISKIEANYLRPELKEKNYYEGSVVTSKLLTGIITKDITVEDLKIGYQSTVIAIIIIFLILFIILIPVSQFKTVREDTYGSKPVGFVSAMMIRYGKTFIGRHSFDDFAHSVGQFKVSHPNQSSSGGGASHGKW
ncbi:MAG: TPM domain-containing protein [Cytophagales bacterium]|nr:TPM domain-containing protein [Cytophaga sp.]